MPLMLILVSRDANSVSNGTIPFAGSRWSKWEEHYSFAQVMPLAPESVSCYTNGIINGTNFHLFSQDNGNKVQTLLFSYFMPLALASVSQNVNNIIISGTNAYLSLRLQKWDATWLFCHVMPLTSTLTSHDANGIGVMWCLCIGVSIMWCGHHH